LPAGSQILCQQIGGICAAAGICFMPSRLSLWLSPWFFSLHHVFT